MDESLFVLELDGDTFGSREELDMHCQYLDEEAAETGWLRAAENRYRTPDEGFWH